MEPRLFYACQTATVPRRTSFLSSFFMTFLNLTGSDFARLLKLIQPTPSGFHTLAVVLHGQQTLITRMMFAFSCLQRVFSLTSKGQDLHIVGTS